MSSGELGESKTYVHGYGEREAQRLMDQAESVWDLIHHDAAFPPNSRILEVACGVGAQTVEMAQQLSDCRFVSFDKIPHSVGLAKVRVRAAGLQRVHLLTADLFEAPFKPESFDVLFVSYLLEHLPDPLAALTSLKALLRPGGDLLVVEGDHGSCYFHPDTPEAIRTWKCLIEVQAGLGCDSEIGRRLYPLLQSAGFEDVRVSPRMVYADQSRPHVQNQFVLQTIVPMVEGVRTEALAKGLMSPAEWEKGVADLRESGLSSKGTFCYTFFKASATKRG